MIGVHQNRSGHLLMDTPDNRHAPDIDSVPAKPRRRRHSQAFKQRVLAEVLAGQESVSVIARRHDINANLLFKWKRLHQAEPGGSMEQANSLVPIQADELAGDQSPDIALPGRIEIVLGAERWITVHGNVSRDVLQTALEVLTR